MQGKVGRRRQAVGAAPVPDDFVWKAQLFHEPNDTLRLRDTKVMDDQHDFLLALPDRAPVEKFNNHMPPAPKYCERLRGNA
jgi:hypothetical protein